MEKSVWCKRKYHFVKPNKVLSQAYITKAIESLDACRKVGDIRDWKICTAYYAMYFALYALLMRIGIRCENHECTIHFAMTYLDSYLSREEMVLTERSRVLRVNSLYFTDIMSEDLHKDIEHDAALMVDHCREILNQLTEKAVKSLRVRISD